MASTPTNKRLIRVVELLAFVGLAAGILNNEWVAAQPGAGPSISATRVVQYNGKLMVMPTGNLPTSRHSNLSLQVDPRWVNNYGYHPVQVTIRSQLATKVAHSIRIRLRSGWYRGTKIAEQEFEMPAGSVSTTTSVLLPYFDNMSSDYLWWDLWVDGVRDKDLSLERSNPAAFNGGIAISNSGINVLLASTPVRSRSVESTNNSELQVFLLDPAEYPTTWLGYSAFDVVELSLDRAQQLAKTNPAVFNAILQWVRSGGQLWISDVGQELENLPQLSKLVGLSEKAISDTDIEPTSGEAVRKEDVDRASGSPDGSSNDGEKAVEQKADAKPEEIAGKTENGKDTTSEASPNAALPPRQEGWRPLQYRRFRGREVTFLDKRNGSRQTVRDPELIAQFERDANFIKTDQRFNPGAFSGERRFRNSIENSNEWFVQQSLGFGTVRAQRGASETAKFVTTQPASNANSSTNSESSDTLSRALTFGLRRTLRWDARHGITPDGASAEFANLLVPGVGMAPVTEFRVLITVFVLLIGPLNYWLLRRNKRLHLMVLTVPLAAIVTTLALSVYAIVADGFGSQVRVHSFTRLDQRTGNAACWSRLSYYSGLAPGKGLAIPNDTVLYPVQPSWANDVNRSEQRTIVWDGDQGHFVQGWLNSRTPTQYLTVRSRKVPYGLEVLDSGENLRVKNGLGVTIQFLAVLNETGKWYEGEEIARDGSLVLTATTRDDVIRRLSKVVAENAPHVPTELSDGDAELRRMRSRSRFGIFARYGVNESSGNLSDNLAGIALADLVGLGDQPALDLPVKSYVAITEHGPEVEVGFPDVTEEASFHVVEGRW